MLVNLYDQPFWSYLQILCQNGARWTLITDLNSATSKTPLIAVLPKLNEFDKMTKKMPLISK